MADIVLTAIYRFKTGEAFEKFRDGQIKSLFGIDEGEVKITGLSMSDELGRVQAIQDALDNLDDYYDFKEQVKDILERVGAFDPTSEGAKEALSDID